MFGLYCGVAAGYAALDAILVVVIFSTDFQKYADEAVQRSEMRDVSAGDVLRDSVANVSKGKKAVRGTACVTKHRGVEADAVELALMGGPVDGDEETEFLDPNDRMR